MSTRRLNRLSNPSGPMHVTQAARCFLEVRLELVNGIAVLPIANRLHPNECLQKPIATLLYQTGKDLAFKFVSSRTIAQEEARIQKRRVRLHVRFVKLLEVRALPDLMAHLEVEVP